MKVVIAGGSGQVGNVLARAFERAGDQVVILSRGERGVRWDGRTAGPWIAEIDGADVVVNLAGRSVNCRYTEANRREIMDSRVDSTRILGRAIADARRPPRLWLQASTATIYAHTYDAPNDERSGRLGGDEPGAPETWRFSIDVARAWERAFEEAETPATRKHADALPRRYPTILTVDRDHFKLRLFKRLKLSKTYPIAVGMAGLDTPAGLYSIQNKEVNPAWHVPNSSWAARSPGRRSPAARRTTRSRPAGWVSPTVSGSTAPPRTGRSARVRRTAASACM